MSIRDPSQAELCQLYFQQFPDETTARAPSISPIRLTQRQLDDLLAAIKPIETPIRAEALREELTQAAEYFTSELWFQETPALSFVERELLEISSSAKRLRRQICADSLSPPMTFAIRAYLQIAAQDYGNRVGGPDGFDRREFPWDFFSAHKLPAAIQGIELLAHLAESSAAMIRNNELKGKTKGTAFGKPRKSALRVFVHRLALTWLHAKGKPPGAGVDASTGKASGPFFRFAALFLSALRGNVKNDQRRYLPTIDAELKASPDTVRAHLKVFKHRLLPEAERARKAGSVRSAS